MFWVLLWKKWDKQKVMKQKVAALREIYRFCELRRGLSWTREPVLWKVRSIPISNPYRKSKKEIMEAWKKCKKH